MKYICILIVSLFAHPAFSQENDSMAKKSFTMAQAAFAEGQYKETVDYLKYAETYSGGATPRILYIKIKALNQLSNSDKSYLPALQSSCEKFFEMIDKSTYSKEKYDEIAAIMAQKSGQKIVATSVLDKKAQEKMDYDKAIKAHTKEAYKEFLDQYSFTPLANDIQKKYDELVESDYERTHHRLH